MYLLTKPKCKVLFCMDYPFGENTQQETVFVAQDFCTRCACLSQWAHICTTAHRSAKLNG